MKTTFAMFVLGLGILLGTGNPAAADYHCGKDTCFCVSTKDCATMGADHVCQVGTYKDGVCTAKKY
jgi:hypothetical protein